MSGGDVHDTTGGAAGDHGLTDMDGGGALADIHGGTAFIEQEERLLLGDKRLHLAAVMQGVIHHAERVHGLLIFQTQAERIVFGRGTLHEDLRIMQMQLPGAELHGVTGASDPVISATRFQIIPTDGDDAHPSESGNEAEVIGMLKGLRLRDGMPFITWTQEREMIFRCAAQTMRDALIYLQHGIVIFLCGHHHTEHMQRLSFCEFPRAIILHQLSDVKGGKTGALLLKKELQAKLAFATGIKSGVGFPREAKGGEAGRESSVCD